MRVAFEVALCRLIAEEEVSDIPLAIVEKGRLEPLKTDYKPRRSDREVTLRAHFDDRVTILYYYPNMRPDVIDALVGAGYRGIVIAGTGLGHRSRTCCRRWPTSSSLGRSERAATTLPVCESS